MLNTPEGTYYLPDGLEGKHDHSPEDYIRKNLIRGTHLLHHGGVQAHPFLQLCGNNQPLALRLGKLRLHVPLAPDRKGVCGHIPAVGAKHTGYGVPEGGLPVPSLPVPG